jgi:toxin ParE1/3/4
VKKLLKLLKNIWIYTAENWSVEQANRYYNLIIDEIEYVSKYFEEAKYFGKVRKNYRYSKYQVTFSVL